MDRTQLFDTLSNLPPAAFERLLFAISPPGGLIPGDTAPPINRVKALLDWAESPTGQGIDEVKGHLDQLSILLGTGQTMPDFRPYLQSILDDEDYLDWQGLYTPTTVEGQKPAPSSKHSRRLKLRAETVKSPNDERLGGQTTNQREEIEQLDVLDGLRKYAAGHVLLIGKPGSGKSTSLEWLLWNEAQNALEHPEAKIPVLVKLRRCTSTIEAHIRDFFSQHHLPLNVQDVEHLLQQGKVLLLLDGLNELPEAFSIEIANFRERYRKTTPMIVSTRDLSVGGTLGIVKTLKMLPLSEPQMREFVLGYLPKEGDRLFQQLKGDTLRKFAETPLLLWMLCRVFAKNGQVPANLGLAFREFTQLFDRQIQEDAPADSKDQWPKLLRHLAFALMHDKELVEFRLSMPREEAENLLTAFLQQEGRTNARENAERWLQDLLDYHLIQPVIQENFEEHIEFRHQLIQEYYAAEHLLRLLQPPNGELGLTDEQLKQDYLNYLKWTEPIALMLALLNDGAQALRVVKLAINEVDLRFGARLSGEVNQLFQRRALCIISDLEAPILLEIILFGDTKSEYAIPKLKNILSNQSFDDSLRDNAARAIGKIGNQEAVKCLIQTVKDEDEVVFGIASHWLGKIGGKDATSTLLEFLSHKNLYFCQKAADALGYISEKQVAFTLCKVLCNQGLDGKELELYVSLALKRIGENMELPFPCQNLAKEILLKYQNSKPREEQKNVDDVYQGSDQANIEEEICRQLTNDNLSPLELVNLTGNLLERQGSHTYSCLLNLLKHRRFGVRFAAARALAEVNCKESLPFLLQGISTKDTFFYTTSSIALKRIGDPNYISQMYALLARIERIRSLHLKSILEVITAIQSRCKYYNHEIWWEVVASQKSTLNVQDSLSDVSEQKAITIHIGNLNAYNAAINLGSTIHGDQIGTQNP